MRIIRKKQKSVAADLEEYLKANHCHYTVEKEEKSTVYTFEFQAGNFVASIRQQDDCMEVTFPCMASAPLHQLALVRSKCNERNNSNILFKFFYTLDHEKHEIDVHMSFFNNHVDADNLTHELKAAFHFQREWLHDFDEAVSTCKDYDTSDLESEVYKHHREMYMLRHMEMKHQMDTSALSLTNSTETLPLSQLLSNVMPLPESQLLFMTVNTVSGQQRVDKEEAISSYDLRRALVEGEGRDARLVRDYALLDLHYKQGRDQQPRLLTVALTAEGEDDHSIYTRVTVTQVPRNASRMNSLSNEGRQPRSVSLLIALDRNDDHQRQSEFEYMWTDAQLKLRNGEANELTEEQQMLSQVNVADVAYNLYWGQQLFLAERYYEAILHLENVFNSFRANFFEMSPEHKRVFMEVAYKLGFCYNDLGLYKQAFYYLDLMASDGNIRHTMELVNTMANSKDLRLFNYTEGIMEEVKNNFGEDELPDNIKDFINFLRRRRAYSYIEFNDLDKAEKIFTQMLDEEENADYAINELAYIKRLRQQRGEDTIPSKDIPGTGLDAIPPF